MKFKTKQLVDRFAQIISEWPGVECISLNEAALPDTLDPYFALILDIYFNDSIPLADKRRELYGDDIDVFESTGYESAKRESKDRFLIGDIPVRLEYKSVKLIDEKASIAHSRLESLWLIKDSGTYGFYRLTNGEIIFSRTGWILELRKRLQNLGNEFWQSMISANESKMEHFLSDLGAAAIQKDEFHYLISSAGFIKSVCLTLFSINRRFEPSHRAYYKQVLELPVLPEAFHAQLETFLRSGIDLGMERKFSLAQVIAREILSLGSAV
ncbi:MAG: DUF4037 domain-containing protein [Treponema sp.]|jgi:hypothetical protein|nr:DUF4037 domain-containing protein [Treponema sp.]